MAPTKASKRSTSALATTPSPDDASPAKKSRVDPIFAGIIETLEGADDLNEHCRAMLIGMVRPSLGKAKSERHHMQQLGVNMIEEALQAHKRTLIEGVEEANLELAELAGSKNALLQHVDDANTFLAAKKTATASAKAAHEQTKEATKIADEALEGAKVLQERAQTLHTVLEKERVAIQSAYEEHFKTPMESDQGPHHIFLRPFIDQLGFEESLLCALPSSCMKTKEQRGGFDDLVLTELGKSIQTKIAEYTEGVSDAALAISDLKAGVALEEQAVEDRRQTEKTAAENLEAATVAQREAEEKVAKASAEWKTFEPRVHAASDKYNLHESKRIVFEDGPLQSFETFRDKDTPLLVEVEAAPAGA